jgi:hypothetical protein
VPTDVYEEPGGFGVEGSSNIPLNAGDPIALHDVIVVDGLRASVSDVL